jgi:hypothetical protein
MNWDVPWYPGEVVNTIFLAAATLVVLAVPAVYATYANLRDPLARAVLAGTSVTGVAFVVTLIATLAFHWGWEPSVDELNWLARGLYAAVAIGKATFLFAVIRVIREGRRERRAALRDAKAGR